MVSIRLQRRGRRGQAQFRLVVQDSRRSPVSGRVIANLGFYNPHSKEHGIDFDKVAFYLKHGAQPSKRVVKFLIEQKVDLPTWVQKPIQKETKVRYPGKLRRNRPVSNEKEEVVVEEKTQAAEEIVEKTTTDNEKMPQEVNPPTETQPPKDEASQEKAEAEATTSKTEEVETASKEDEHSSQTEAPEAEKEPPKKS